MKIEMYVRVKDEKAGAELLSTLIPTIMDARPDAWQFNSTASRGQRSLDAVDNAPTLDDPRSGDQDDQPESMISSPARRSNISDEERQRRSNRMKTYWRYKRGGTRSQGGKAENKGFLRAGAPKRPPWMPFTTSNLLFYRASRV
jgi:hypothetical protein